MTEDMMQAVTWKRCRRSNPPLRRESISLIDQSNKRSFYPFLVTFARLLLLLLLRRRRLLLLQFCIRLLR